MVRPLALFRTDFALKVLEKDLNTYGTARLVFSSDASSLEPKALTDSVQIKNVVHKGDTLVTYYDHSLSKEWQLQVGKDTITIKPLQRTDFLAKQSVQFAGASPQTGKSKTKNVGPVLSSAPLIAAEQPITASSAAKMALSAPIVQFDTSKWHLTRVVDSTWIQNYSIRIAEKDPTILFLDLPMSKSNQYALTILPGALTDIWGAQNIDTLKASFRVLTGEDIGQIDLTVNALSLGASYLLELQNGTNTIKSEAFQAEAQEKKFSFPALFPATYSVRIIQDNNANGRWDTGDYFKKRQPESIYSQNLEAVRPNWTVEATVTLGATVAKKGKILKKG